VDSAIQDYIQEARTILSEPLSAPARLRRLRSAASRMVEKPIQLTPVQKQLPEEGYGRNLLYRDPDHEFVVIAMVWPPGKGGPPHDHGTWGVVAVTEGTVRIVNYEREDDGSDNAHAKLFEVNRMDATPGQVGWVLPPHQDIHEIGNPSNELAVSIHTYGHDIPRCLVFDPETGAAEEVELGYLYEPC